jgi:hypothetical protein
MLKKSTKILIEEEEIALFLDGRVIDLGSKRL